jgi:hypothetical protein
MMWERALEHVIQSSLSVVFKLHKTATKPAEFSGLNTTNSLYPINLYLYHLIILHNKALLLYIILKL